MFGRSSAGFRWTLRLLLWSVGIAFMLPLYRAGVAFHDVDTQQQCANETASAKGPQAGLFQQQRFCLCMFLHSGYLESRRLEPALDDVMALGAAPCDFVGIWKSARRRSVYRITMRDDNTFTSEPVADYGRMSGSAAGSGYWGENDGRLVWIYQSGVTWPPDINRIESQSADKFTLIETSGERTEFTRERPLQSARCPSA
jgi:hypothetical protein